METLPLVQVVPEMSLTLNPSTGMLGAAFSLEDINKELDALEAAADDFMNSLDPTTVARGSFPGREGVYLTTTTITNIAYGFVIGLVFLVGVILL